MTKAEAYAYRAKIERAATKLTDEEALTSPELFEAWSGRAYKEGERVTDADRDGHVGQSHYGGCGHDLCHGSLL